MTTEKKGKRIIICENCGRRSIDKTKNKSKRFCSERCRCAAMMRKFYRKNPEKKIEMDKKWREKNYTKYRLSIIKSSIRGLTPKQRKEVLDEFKE